MNGFLVCVVLFYLKCVKEENFMIVKEKDRVGVYLIFFVYLSEYW